MSTGMAMTAARFHRRRWKTRCRGILHDDTTTGAESITVHKMRPESGGR